MEITYTKCGDYLLPNLTLKQRKYVKNKQINTFKTKKTGKAQR